MGLNRPSFSRRHLVAGATLVIAGIMSTLLAWPTVSAADPTRLPGKPMNPVATLMPANGGTRPNPYIRVTWDPPTTDGGFPISDYRVEVPFRSSSSWGQPYSSSYYGAVRKQPAGPDDRSFEIDSQTCASPSGNTLCEFRVIATNNMGNSPPASTGPSTYAEPSSPPAQVRVTAATSDVTITWSAPGVDGGTVITGYRVYGYPRTSGSPAKSFDATARSATLTRSQAGCSSVVMTCFVFVTAVNAAGESAPGGSGPAGFVPPNAASDLNAYTRNDGSNLLTWTPSSGSTEPVTRQQVRMRVTEALGGGAGSNVWRTVADLNQTTNSTDVPCPGRDCQYMVISINGAGETWSAPTNLYRVSFLQPVVAWIAADIRSLTATLNWLPANTGLEPTSYRVEIRSSPDQPWHRLAIVGSNTTKSPVRWGLQDPLRPNPEYRVIPVRDEDGPPSEAVTLPDWATRLPPAPYDVDWSFDEVSSDLALRWKFDVRITDPPINGFRVEATSPTSGDWVPLASPGEDARTTTVRCVDITAGCRVRVMARFAAGVGEIAELEIPAQALVPPAHVTGLDATVADDGRVRLEWVNPPAMHTVTGIQIDYDRGPDTGWRTYGSPQPAPVGVLPFQPNRLGANERNAFYVRCVGPTPCRYRVSFVRQGQVTTQSEPVTVTGWSKPTRPSASAQPIDGGLEHLKWSPSAADSKKPPVTRWHLRYRRVGESSWIYRGSFAPDTRSVDARCPTGIGFCEWRVDADNEAGSSWTATTRNGGTGYGSEYYGLTITSSTGAVLARTVAKPSSMPKMSVVRANDGTVKEVSVGPGNLTSDTQPFESYNTGQDLYSTDTASVNLRVLATPNGASGRGIAGTSVVPCWLIASAPASGDTNCPDGPRLYTGSNATITGSPNPSTTIVIRMKGTAVPGYTDGDVTFTWTIRAKNDRRIPSPGSPAPKPGACASNNAATERPSLTRTTDFVVSTASDVSLRVDIPPGTSCRTNISLLAWRLTADIGQAEKKLDFASPIGVLREDYTSLVDTTFAVVPGQIRALTIAAGRLPQGWYEFAISRTSSNQRDVVESQRVRVKIVSPTLERLDRDARSAMRATRDDRWEAVANSDRQFTDFESTGLGDEVSEVFGDLGTAKNIVVQISGLGETAGKRYSKNALGRVESGGGAWNSERIWKESSRTSRYTTAVIGWHGYDAPDFCCVGNDNAAFNGAGNLRADLQGLGLGNTDARRLTVVGHSYGSIVAALSAYVEGQPYDEMVLVGSPGVKIERKGEFVLDPREEYWVRRISSGSPDNERCSGSLGVDCIENVGPAHIWVAAANGDSVTSTFARQGTPPHHDEFGATEFHTAERSGHPGYECSGFPDCHSHYFDTGTAGGAAPSSLWSIAAIARGRPSDVIVRDCSPRWSTCRRTR